MKIKISLLALSLILSISLLAQTKKGIETEEEQVETNGNLVPNGGFERVKEKEMKGLKGFGQLTTVCENWMTPAKTSADLFHIDVKSPKISIPMSEYGTEEALEGSAYAGFRAYSKDPKKTRTYLEVMLTQKLVKDQLYCVRINVSLADLSKFAANNVGVFFSDRKVSNPNSDNALTFAPQVLEKSNRPLNTLQGWQTVCSVYLAKGGEEYIIIGGFGNEDRMKLEKVKKPASQAGIVLNESYYFLDNVEVKSVEAQSQCFCGIAEDRNPELIYSRASAKSIGMKPDQIVKNTSVFFAYLMPDLPEQFHAELNELATLLNANQSIKIELTGHTEADEASEAKINLRYSGLALSRAESVKQYLVDQGIDASRIDVATKDNTSPATDKVTPMGKAQNRRVEFSVK